MVVPVAACKRRLPWRKHRDFELELATNIGGVWLRLSADKQFMEQNGLVSHVHRKKPHRRSMPETTCRTNGRKSAARARVEHVFAEQKGRIGLFIRTI